MLWKKPELINKFEVVESVWGNWHYHIARTSRLGKSLCGKDTMYSGMTLNEWGDPPTHIPYSWCKECKKLMEDENND